MTGHIPLPQFPLPPADEDEADVDLATILTQEELLPEFCFHLLLSLILRLFLSMGDIQLVGSLGVNFCNNWLAPLCSGVTAAFTALSTNDSSQYLPIMRAAFTTTAPFLIVYPIMEDFLVDCLAL
ncbi:hypothetical protein L0F63_004342, partial [Massospora cicadina]